jgi:hypothetical protein
VKGEGDRSRDRRSSALIATAAAIACVLLALPATAGAIRPVGADFRLSVLGPEGALNFGPDESRAGVAFNRRRNEYLAVFAGADTVPFSSEVFGQRVSAAGRRVGPTFRISGPADFSTEPAVAYNSRLGEYLVAYSNKGFIDDEVEIISQRVSATGQLVAGEHRVSNVGPTGDPSRSARLPSIAYNPRLNQYLVAFSGDDEVAAGEFEIHAQRLSAQNGDLGGDFRVSGATDLGADRDAFFPAVAFNSRRNQYLVAFDANQLPNADDVEIFAQRLTATGGALGDDLRVSNTNVADRDSVNPSVAYNAVDDQYLVAFESDRLGPVFRTEVFARRLSGAGAQLGADIRVSRVLERNPDGTVGRAAVAYSPTGREYLVVWDADGLATDNEFEIFAQRLARRGRLSGGNARVSRIGPPGSERAAFFPAVGARTNASQYLTIFTADGLTTDDDYEMFGHRLSAPRCGGRLATLTGTPGRDAIGGTRKRDVIAGLGGRDRLRGLRGNDIICGGRGGDRLVGGPGRDRLLGGPGPDLLLGGRGADRLFGGKGRDRARGGPGPDRLFGGRARDRLLGGPGRDALVGGPGPDRCVGGPGRDRRRRC